LTALTPHVAYRTKQLIVAALVALLAVVPTTCLAWLLGTSEGGEAGARLALAVTLTVNALWIVPVLIAIPLYYRSLRYELHHDEVIVRVGIWTRSVKHVPFRTVTNIKVNRDPLDRLLGIGSLNIQTAGMSGQGGAEESLVGLSDVQAVYDQVAERLRRFRTALSPTQAESDATHPSSDGAVMREILEELRGLRRDANRQRT
jgi:membrane protein YdbS with pleckstrin-like domain